MEAVDFLQTFVTIKKRSLGRPGNRRNVAVDLEERECEAAGSYTDRTRCNGLL
jgi:hypothetical protein